MGKLIDIACTYMDTDACEKLFIISQKSTRVYNSAKRADPCHAKGSGKSGLEHLCSSLESSGVKNSRIKEDFHTTWSCDVNVVAPLVVMEINTRMQNK